MAARGTLDRELNTLQTEKYHPSFGLGPSWAGPAGTFGGLGPFALSLVDQMRQDEQVELCLQYLQTPIQESLDDDDMELVVEGDDPKEVDFVRANVETFWAKGLPVAFEAHPYGRVGAEAVYEDRDGHKRFSFLNPIHPRDARPWTHEGKLVFVKVSGSGSGLVGGDLGDLGGGGVKLQAATQNVPAKGTWWTHGSTYNRWYGRSCMFPIWWPWRAKTQPDAMLDSLLKWMYKWGVTPCVVRSPDEILDDEDTGNVISGADYSIQIVTNVKAGGIVWMSSKRDEHGNYLYSVDQWQKMEGRAPELIDPIEFLNKMIQRGMGIPDEVLTFSGEGSQARASVSTKAFWVSRRSEARKILEDADRQMFRPLAKWNGFRGAYTIALRRKPEQSPGAPGRGMAGLGGGGNDPLAALLGGGGPPQAPPGGAMSQWTLVGEGPRGGKIWRNQSGGEYHGPTPPTGLVPRDPRMRRRKEAIHRARHAAAMASLDAARRAGTVVLEAKQAVAEAKNRIGAASWERIPPRGRRWLATAWRVGKAIEHTVMTGFRKTRELAVEAAKERGAEPETAELVGKILGTVDVVTSWSVNMPAVYALTGSAAAAKAASWAPLASMAYIAYSTARDPWATIRAAKKIVRGGAPAHAALSQDGEADGGPGEIGTRPFAIQLTERIGEHGDWYAALVLAALDATRGNLAAAIGRADEAVKEHPAPPGEDSGHVSLSQASTSDAAFYLALREEVAALREGVRLSQGFAFPVEMAAQRSPKGGVTVAGTFYPGERFIPSSEVAKDPRAMEKIAAGKPVPAEALADYPDLAKSAASETPPQ